MNNSLKLFDDIPEQVGIEKSYYVTYRPVSSISVNAPIDFIIPGSGANGEYVDVNDSRLFVKFSVKDSKGKEIDSTKFHVGLVNLPISSLFSNATLELGHVKVEGDTHLSAYTNYIQTLLSYGPDQSRNLLESWGFVKDTSGNMEASTDNLGLQLRTSALKNGTSNTFIIDGPLPFEFFKQPKYLLSNVEISVKLQPAPANFSLMITKLAAAKVEDVIPTDAQIVIEDAHLTLRKVKLPANLALGHEQGLTKQNALYPFLRTDTRSYTIQKGARSHAINNLYNDRVPKLIIFGFVSNSSMNGTLTSNPFNFNHFNITSIDLQIDGQSVPRKPTIMNFADTSSKCVTEYNNFLQALGNYRCNKEFPISMEEYRNGYTLFAFNLSPDLQIANHKLPYTKGSMCLDIQFKTPTTEVINVVCVGYYDSKIEITQMRNVITNF